MTPQYKLLNPGFSVADAEQPHLVYRDGQLDLQYIDWREKTVRICFEDVVGFQWNDESTFHGNDIRDDSCYEVIESEWIAKHIALGTIPKTHEYRHLLFCFNAAGVLDVLCRQYERLKND